jgi:hypothetical protein
MSKYYHKISYNTFDELAKFMNEIITLSQNCKIIQFGMEIEPTLRIQKPVALVKINFSTDAQKKQFLEKFTDVKPNVKLL